MTIHILGRSDNPDIKSLVNPNIIRQNDVKTLLGEGELGCMLDWRVWNPKTGNILEEHTQKAESFVQQFLQLLLIQMAQTSSLNTINVVDTGGITRTLYTGVDSAQMCNLNVGEASGGTLYGLRVGTGIGAATITDFAMITPIIHGVGASTMQYGAVAFGLPGTDGTSTSQLTITRNFTANAGGITVNEIALYAQAYSSDTGGTIRYFCIIHDSTGGGLGIVVPVGQTLTVNYRPQATI